jgi:hypothetical protein
VVFDGGGLSLSGYSHRPHPENVLLGKKAFLLKHVMKYDRFAHSLAAPWLLILL